jgi:uncharacterized protein (TIGR04255 family)
MRFPDRPRVIYKSNPLVEVVAQVRFSRLLEIEQQLPVDLQKRLAGAYPLLETRDTVSLKIGPQTQPPEAGRASLYDFLSPDRSLKLTLASDYIAATTEKYIKWEDFRPHIEVALKAVMDTYSPPVYTRLGLRYVNAIDKHKIGLGQVPWRELIHPPLLGILASDEIKFENIAELRSATAIALDRGMVTMRCTLGLNTETNQKAYLIDNDFFTDEQLPSDANDALRIFDEFHDESGRAFRWCITERLHTALEPQPFG